MKHIIIDLEMNNLAKEYKKERSICGMETIEIGAVLLDEHYYEIASFKTLVKPQYNTIIQPHIKKLTGITTEMVANAPVFEEALEMFLSWCHSINDDFRIYQWSETDLEQVLGEIILKKVAVKDEYLNLLKDWDDFQKEYGEKLMLENSVSLKNAIMYAGIDFVGNEHDALCDARNTATLLKIVRTPELCKKALDHVIEALTPTPVNTLGDLFDFAELAIGV